MAADTSGDVGWPSLLTSASARRRTAEWGRQAPRSRTHTSSAQNAVTVRRVLNAEASNCQLAVCIAARL